jgi:hypothetical protein
MITAINPATGEMLEKYEETTPNEAAGVKRVVTSSIV